jgi:hypothetical protein
MIRKLLLVAAAVTLPLGMVTILGASSSSASAPPVVATGTVNCTTLSGKIAFVPPLTTAGNSNTETATVGVKLSGCTPSVTSDLGTGAIITGKAVSTVVTTTTNNTANSCAGLATSVAQTQTVKWKDKNSSGVVLEKLAPSTVHFSGFDVVSGGASNSGFDLPQDSGGTASVASGGSFAGSDNGATSEANAFTVDTTAQIGALCSTGVAKLKLGGVGAGSDPSHSFTG